MNLFLSVHIDLKINSDEIVRFLSDPSNMHLWTSHQTIHKIGEDWFDCRENGPVHFRVDFNSELSTLSYQWSSKEKFNSAEITVNQKGANISEVKINIKVPDEAKERTELLISKELRVLKSILEKTRYEELEADQQIIRKHHLTVYQRNLWEATFSFRIC